MDINKKNMVLISIKLIYIQTLKANEKKQKLIKKILHQVLDFKGS